MGDKPAFDQAEFKNSSFFDAISTLREEAAERVAVLQKQIEGVEGPVPAWAPPELEADLIGPLSCRSILAVGSPDDGSLDIVSRLKVTWLGKVYTGNLKQIPWVRRAVTWCWRTLYPLYANRIAVRLAAKGARRWRPLIKLERYVATRDIPTTQLLGEAQATTPTPKVFPTEDQATVSPPGAHYDFPALYAATISNGLIFGGSNLVFTKDAVVCHDLFDVQRDYTSEELHGRHLLDVEGRRLRLLYHDKQPEHVPIAAVFVDACAQNYAHWLTEVLPRIAAFCAEPRLENAPIVVDHGLHKNIMTSMFLVTGSEREVITLPIGRGLRVDSLYVTSVAGYVPFDRRYEALDNYSHGKFSPRGFELMRERITAKVGHERRQAWPRKIYLRRNSGTRIISNVVALEKLLVSRDFVVVEPERLTFIEQVQLFENAEVIVGPTGAALANGIFCKPGARLVVLMSKHEKMIYGYWLNMLAPLRVEVSYVLGVADRNRHLGIHSDFTVNCQDVIDCLDSEVKP